MSKFNESTLPCDKMVKILLIGNSGVGKSSILLQYSDKKFVHNYYNTIGVDYKIKYVNFKGLSIKLQIWDTAGQDRFKTITSSYYRGADGIIVVYDITDRTSYENVKNWLEEIDKFVDEKTKKYIIGNKCDLEERRQVSTEEALQLTSKMGIPFKETSARLATNIQTIFQELVDLILSKDSTLMAKTNKSIETPSSNPSNPNSSYPKTAQEKQEGMNIKEMLQQKKKEQQSQCCTIY